MPCAELDRNAETHPRLVFNELGPTAHERMHSLLSSVSNTLDSAQGSSQHGKVLRYCGVWEFRAAVGFFFFFGALYLSAAAQPIFIMHKLIQLGVF